MKQFFRVASTYKYYNYLTKYDKAFIRKNQLYDNYYLGQKSLWRTLVYKMSGDHINLEEEHNVKYKTHMTLVNLSYRLGIFFFAYMIIYVSMFLGEIGHIFNVVEYDHLINPIPNDDYPTRYEKLYISDRVMKY